MSVMIAQYKTVNYLKDVHDWRYVKSSISLRGIFSDVEL